MIKIISLDSITKLSEEEKDRVVYLTKEGDSFSQKLNPSNLGPINVYANYWAKDFKKAIDFCYVPEEFSGALKMPTEQYIVYALKGWAGLEAPKQSTAYIWFDGIKRDPLFFRKYIFTNLYIQNIKNNDDFHRLERFFHKNTKMLFLVDETSTNFDVTIDNFEELFSDPSLKFNHVHVLAMYLQGIIDEIY